MYCLTAKEKKITFLIHLQGLFLRSDRRFFSTENSVLPKNQCWANERASSWALKNPVTPRVRQLAPDHILDDLDNGHGLQTLLQAKEPKLAKSKHIGQCEKTCNATACNTSVSRGKRKSLSWKNTTFIHKRKKATGKGIKNWCSTWLECTGCNPN